MSHPHSDPALAEKLERAADMLDDWIAYLGEDCSVHQDSAFAQLSLALAALAAAPMPAHAARHQGVVGLQRGPCGSQSNRRP